MLSFLASKKISSLIDLGFHYFRVVEYMLDISSPAITNVFWLLHCHTVVGSTVVKNCSLYQTRFSYE